jgi:hypothetical protein
MHSADTLDRMAAVAKRKNATARTCNYTRAWRTAALSLGLCLAALPARAVDGCTVLLCFAAPNWRAISQCVPPIRQVLRDLARGKAFPTCAMAGASNSASHQWASAPSNCPPQYTRVGYAESSPIYSCDYTGAVSVSIDGAPWARTWWSFGGETVTEFAPGAKTQLGTWNTQFDDDYAAWLALQPPPVEPCTACGG